LPQFCQYVLQSPNFWLHNGNRLSRVYGGVICRPSKLIKFTDNPIGNLGMFIIPAIILGMGMVRSNHENDRTMMLEVCGRIMSGRLGRNGLKERGVVIRHALKNALIPVITIMARKIAGYHRRYRYHREHFQSTRYGQLITDAPSKRDYTVVSAVMLLFAFVMVFINLAVDVTYGFLDPGFIINSKISEEQGILWQTIQQQPKNPNAAQTR